MPKLLDNVLELAKIDKTQCEIALMVLRSLAEDVSNEFSDNMTNLRKTELKTALNKCLDQLFKFFYSMYGTAFDALKNARDTKNVYMNFCYWES